MVSPSLIFFVFAVFCSNQQNAAMAWQVSAPTTSTPQGSDRQVNPTYGDRRQLLFQIAISATLSTLTTFPQVSKAASAALTTEAARNQWKQALTTMDELLKDWSTVASSGDAIRTQLGTQGTVSPLFQIDKVLKVLRDDVDDFIEFQETAEEFELALSRADSMAYSANFAGGSGKPTPPAVYIEKSKTEVIEMIRIAKKLNAML